VVVLATPYNLASDNAKIPGDDFGSAGPTSRIRVANMSMARLAARACKSRPVLFSLLRPDPGAAACGNACDNTQQLRHFGFGSHMNDNDPVLLPLPRQLASVNLSASSLLKCSPHSGRHADERRRIRIVRSGRTFWVCLAAACVPCRVCTMLACFDAKLMSSVLTGAHSQG